MHHSDDLDFQEALIEYVRSLEDAHASISYPASYFISLPISVDIYDGKVLIDGINRALLPLAQYPFGIGDEIVSFDGQPVQEVIEAFRKYGGGANPSSTDRVAASRLVARRQAIMPKIVEVGDTATIGIRLAGAGATNTYTLQWVKSGIPVLSQGPVPSPVHGQRRLSLSTDDPGVAVRAVDGAPIGPVFQRPDLPRSRACAVGRCRPGSSVPTNSSRTAALEDPGEAR